MQSASHTVRSYLLSAITSGSYAAGARLPTERALSETLSIGRGAVRSALAVMEAEGHVLRVAGSGTYVADRKAARHTLAQLTSPTQVMEARLALEPALARLVAAHGTAADFDVMENCIRAGAGAETIDAFEHWDAAFHEAIAVATRNPILIAAYKLVTEARNHAEWGALKRRTLTQEARATYQQDHAAILDALRNRDTAAARDTLHGHLVAIRKALLGD